MNSELGVLSQTDTTGTTSFTRDPSGGLISERAPSGTYYYLFDTHGSVVAVTSSTGAVSCVGGGAALGVATLPVGPELVPGAIIAGCVDAAPQGAVLGGVQGGINYLF